MTYRPGVNWEAVARQIHREAKDFADADPEGGGFPSLDWFVERFGRGAVTPLTRCPECGGVCRAAGSCRWCAGRGGEGTR